MKCRYCSETLNSCFVDLGSSPPSNAYLDRVSIMAPEKWFPLKILVCEACWLVQTEDFADRGELFNHDYAYFSSFSDTWMQHSSKFKQNICERLNLNQKSFVVEVAANDGYLLQFFSSDGIPCVGIEPTLSTAQAARGKGIKIIQEFFGEDLGRKICSDYGQADLIIANNVLAHVPDINDFLKGFVELLKPNGVATFEFPSFLNLVEGKQFDTIYHEHFSYLSVTAAVKIFSGNSLDIFDVEEFPTHGGSVRIYAQNSKYSHYPTSNRLNDILSLEINAGIKNPIFYQGFSNVAAKIKNDLLSFLINAKADDKLVCGYGAAAKGNTLLNYSGIRPDLLPFVADKNPAKQNKFLPGSRIPVFSEEEIYNRKPDYVLILPWNIKVEIQKQLAKIRNWNGKFVTAVPNLEIF